VIITKRKSQRREQTQKERGKLK